MATDMRELVEIGKRHFEGKHYTRAEQVFQKIVKSGARYADVLNMLGLIYHLEGKFNNALDSFEKALAINPDYHEATLNLAVLYNDLGEFKKAKALYARVGKKKGPRDFEPILKSKIANMHAHLGDAYRGIGKAAEAIEEYKKALKLCPDYADIRTRLGIAYRENNQKDLSAKELASAVSGSPAYKAAQIQLGVTYFGMGQKEKAAKAWKALLSKDKDNAIAKVYLTLCSNGKKL